MTLATIEVPSNFLQTMIMHHIHTVNSRTHERCKWPYALWDLEGVPRRFEIIDVALLKQGLIKLMCSCKALNIMSDLGQ